MAEQWSPGTYRNLPGSLSCFSVLPVAQESRAGKGLGVGQIRVSQQHKEGTEVQHSIGRISKHLGRGKIYRPGLLRSNGICLWGALSPVETQLGQ